MKGKILTVGLLIGQGVWSWVFCILFFGLVSCKRRISNNDPLYAEVPGSVRAVEIAPGMAIPFCWVPPGELSIQTFPGSSGAAARVLRVNEGFWMSCHEVTRGVWCQVMGGSVPNDKAEFPVSEISWWDCRGFIAKLPSPGKRWAFDLPSDSEWEYACRAGSSAEFYGDPMQIGWMEGNSDGGSHPVGLLEPNAWGLHDMHGNVAEWCQDELNEGISQRVIHGGSWASDWNAQASVRDSDVPGLKIDRIGFRLVIRRNDR